MLGPCTYERGNYKCLCTQGIVPGVIDLNFNDAQTCDTCLHPIAMHLDYARPALPPAITAPALSGNASPDNTTSGNNPPKRRIRPYSLSSRVHPRTKLVNELIERLHYYHIIRVRGTPASGKTTLMNIVVNQLFENHGKERPIYVLTDWNERMIRGQGGWDAYLEQETGVHGDQWLTYSAYLVIDEAQESYWDGALWADLFKRIELDSSPYILLFTSYGSPGRGFVGFNEEKHRKTPLIFAPEQQISLRADENVRGYNPFRAPFLTPVGLLLDKDEAMDVVTLITKQMQSRPSLTEDLKEC
ncbi:uncharacterized protein ACHE_70884S [Aspergillus chevalieri]|uniref:Uncharacterized protein n=1 Tax=Aspergillus chevalieri TaxID=182096 RepID=A0A7R7VWI6_ASPCH|nr:uncharacterized protein ACHE_70884S [Aspergillus chevalieri]BCR92041.1 hypothetical protein ACHE_70884S [Aspergillus chevalieri]